MEVSKGQSLKGTISLNKYVNIHLFTIYFFLPQLQQISIAVEIKAFTSLLSMTQQRAQLSFVNKFARSKVLVGNFILNVNVRSLLKP